MSTSPLPLNEKPYFNTDAIANSIAADDMFDCYLEPVPDVGFVTRRRPGLKLFADLGTGFQGDGLFYWDGKGKAIAVSGGRIFDLAADGTFTDITGEALKAGIPVTFAEGQDTGGAPWLYLANGKLVYTTGGNTAAPTDTNTPAATHVAFLKGSFLANESGTNRFDFTDTNPDTAKRVFSLAVLPSADLAFVTDSIRPLEASQPWTQDIETSGGVAPITLSCAALPSGFALAGNTLSCASPVVGTYDFTITATDSAGTPVVANKDFTATVVATPDTLAITSAGIIGGTVGIAMEETASATGGSGVITWSAVGLPYGMALSTAGVLTGTPTAVADTTFALSVSDSSAAMQTATASFTLSIAAQPEVLPGTTATFVTTTLSDATVGVKYSQQAEATGTTGDASWTSYGLPDGLAISDTGLISGVPTGDAGIAAVTLSVTDSKVTGLLDNTYWSSSDNPLTCDAKGDTLAALIVAWQEIYAWGTSGLEIWQDDGVTPFSPIAGAFSEGGIEAPYSTVIADNTVFALCTIAGARVVVKLLGRAPVVCSDAIGRVLSDMPTVSDAIGDLISVGGLSLYILSFPTAGQTWAYDYKNDVWSQWGYWQDGEHQRFIGQHSCFVKPWNKHLIMSRLDGRIFELDRNTFDDAGNEMISYRRTGWLNNGTYNRKVCDQLYVKVKRGEGDIGTLMIRWRDDGRAEWGNWFEVALSPIGDRDFVSKNNRFGMYRSRQYEFRISGAADLVLVGVDTEMRGLSS